MNFLNGESTGESILTNSFILKATVDLASSDVRLVLRPQPAIKTSLFIAAGTVLLDSRSVNLVVYWHIHSNLFM